MSSPTVILVNGISATGKTTIAKFLGEALGWPVFAKDAVKEALFESLGYSDRAWAHKLSGTTHATLNPILEELLRCGISFIIESNFNPLYDTEKYNHWRDKYHVQLIQLLCYVTDDSAYHRFKSRVETGERHPGHCDAGNIEPFRDYLLAGKAEPLPIVGKLIEIDTTDFDQLDRDSILAQIKALTAP
ncbi:MAG: AAA family ATPase [Armatimonadetes bacterium]|nr:AAA family ATPase [Armatimonadota bacterium]